MKIVMSVIGAKMNFQTTMLNKFTACLILFFCLQGTLSASELVKFNEQQLEQDIVSRIETNKNDAVALLEKVVNINSGTMNFSGVKKVADIFTEEFKSLGFKAEWISAEKFNRSGHLLASYGNRGPKLLLIGHLDTVFSKDSAFQKFQRIDNRYVKGPGISDMKGGDVVLLYTLKALKQTKALDNFQIKVILMGDEEKRGVPVAEASKILLDAGKWADVALGFEDGDGNPKTAVISRRGATSWHLTVTAKAAHSSQIFKKEIGFGAIFEASRILDGFLINLTALRENNLTFNPGVMVAGTRAELNQSLATGEAFGKTNVVAQIAKVSGDLRAVSPQQLAQAKKQMQNVVTESFSGTESSIIFEDGYPPMASTAGNKKLLKLYSEISEELGYGEVVAVNPRNAGAADISFVASDVDMALDGLGLMGVKGHTIEETADMDTLTQQTTRAALLIVRLQKFYN